MSRKVNIINNVIRTITKIKKIKNPILFNFPFNEKTKLKHLIKPKFDSISISLYFIRFKEGSSTLKFVLTLQSQEIVLFSKSILLYMHPSS
ncbi:MAG: hypothetical protein J6W87_01985, partial [Clostridia bacterium]|nr:hypothetical protein [Clostridia bacterium]